MFRLGVLFAIALTAQQAAPNSALIVGRVIDQSDQRPISGAVVEIANEAALLGGTPPAAQPRRQMTDSLGRFVFRELPAGTYTIRARTGGNGFGPSGFIVSGAGNPISAYIGGGYGQRRPGGPLELVTLADGQSFPGAVVRLWRGGVINGTVLDDLGEPIVDSQVGAVQVSSDGRLTDGPTTRTDDRGRYRLSGLLPGRYIVFVSQTVAAMSAEAADAGMQRIAELNAARTPSEAKVGLTGAMGIRVGTSIVNTMTTSNLIDGSVTPRRDGDTVFVFQTTFHPQATTLGAAVAVEVGVSEDKGGVDVFLIPVRAAGVSGTVMDQGVPASGVRLRIMPVGTAPEASLFETATTVTDAQGRFTFPVVPVGNYTIATSIQPIVPAQGPPVQHSVAHPGGMDAWLSESVAVGPDGVSGLSLSLKNSYAVKAQVEFVGTTPRPTDQQMPRITMGLRAVRPRGRLDVTGAQFPLTAAGTVMFSGISPGRYTIRLMASPPGTAWRLQSVTAGGREVDDMPIEINEDMDDVRIVLTDRPAALGGRVTSADPASGSPAVILFPSDRRLWPDARALGRRFRLVRTSASGEFSIPDVPTGDYLVIAVVDDLAAKWPDAAFIATLATQADTLRVTPGSRAALALTIKTPVKLP